MILRRIKKAITGNLNARVGRLERLLKGSHSPQVWADLFYQNADPASRLDDIEKRIKALENINKNKDKDRFRVVDIGNGYVVETLNVESGKYYRKRDELTRVLIRFKTKKEAKTFLKRIKKA